MNYSSKTDLIESSFRRRANVDGLNSRFKCVYCSTFKTGNTHASPRAPDACMRENFKIISYAPTIPISSGHARSCVDCSSCERWWVSVRANLFFSLENPSFENDNEGH